jgi:hypothetical protein
MNWLSMSAQSFVRMNFALTDEYLQHEVTVLDESQFVLIQPNEGYYHIAKYFTNGTFIGWLTSGKWDVISIDAYFQPTNSMYISISFIPCNSLHFSYYTSAEVSPSERHVYR